MKATMEPLLLLAQIFFSLILLGFFSLLMHLYNTLILSPKKLRSKLLNQGIQGPSPSYLYGNLPDMKRIRSTVKKEPTSEESVVRHDYYSNLYPYFELWRNEYGPILMYSTGTIQILYVTQPELVKEISLWTSLDLGRPSYLQRDRRPLFGQGIITSNGSTWSLQRKIIAPELYMDKIKGMINLMVDSATSVLKSWESKIESEGGIADIRVDLDLRSFSANVITRACFGSSFTRGKEIFSMLSALQQVMSIQLQHLGVPGLRHLPTKNNREMWRLEKEISSLILKVVKERIEAQSEKDLLQMILEGANSSAAGSGLEDTDRFIVDNCKNIYFAGYETTATTASWALMLLALYPEWQNRVRAEVEQVCSGCSPDANMLPKMKVLTMVIQEALRLYPVAAFVAREACEDLMIADILVPKGVSIFIPIVRLHQDPEIWGSEAHEFDPDRFAHGIAGACTVPQAYMPFGFGPRTCVGQNLAMVELKIILSLILSRFSFTLSSKYRHSPTFKLIIEPEHGVDLIMKKI